MRPVILILERGELELLQLAVRREQGRLQRAIATRRKVTRGLQEQRAALMAFDALAQTLRRSAVPDR